MIVSIQDDFDLNKIISSGQCFRAREIENKLFRFIMGKNVLYMQEVGNNEFSVSCNLQQWNNIWKEYFDLDRNYSAIRKLVVDYNEFISASVEAGKGLRILKQDPWEMLIAFIVSQRKNIPAIVKSIEALAHLYGEEIQTDYESVYAFPSPFEMYSATDEDFRKCGLGYRVPYVKDAIHMVTAGLLKLEEITTYNTIDLLAELQNVYGVGKKVANCVALFAYGRTSCVPVDVWISRAIQEECGGDNPFPQYGEYAGIIQQYVFYYQKSRH